MSLVTTPVATKTLLMTLVTLVVALVVAFTHVLLDTEVVCHLKSQVRLVSWASSIENIALTLSIVLTIICS